MPQQNEVVEEFTVPAGGSYTFQEKSLDMGGWQVRNGGRGGHRHWDCERPVGAGKWRGAGEHGCRLCTHVLR